jgi:hypothetical protein
MLATTYGVAIALAFSALAASDAKKPLERELVQSLEKSVASGEPEWRMERATNYGSHLIQLWEPRPRDGEARSLSE